jgi:heme/copper-type cytochrome/quinol oxidase subunit 3
VAQATTLTHGAVEPAETPLTPESWGKLGMWIFLAGDAVGFGILLAGYGAARAAAADWPSPAEHLGINIPGVMTFLLICSSVTMVKALEAIQQGRNDAAKRFLLLTIVGGLLFLGMQGYEWTHLITQDMKVFANPWGASLFGTTFYLITGFHGLHVTGGVIYLSVILAAISRFPDRNYNYMITEIAGLYWHFVDLVWIMVFTFIYLL